MDPRKDDSAPAESSDTGGTAYRATHDDSRSERDSAAAADPTAAARATTVIPYRVSVAHILAYTLATGQIVVRRLYFTAYTSYRRRHREYLLGYIAEISDRYTS
jgi:hypothetical protein